MKIALVTPAAPRSRAGNRTTATRWAKLLREAGHDVAVLEQWQAEDPAFDLMIALHAWRSADSIVAFAQRFAQRPLIVVLTGTDIYRFQHSHRAVTIASLDCASALIGLHDHVAQDIPRAYHDILHTVYQSAQPLPPSYPGPTTKHFTICVVGHLREEKDSLRAAEAARLLPPESRVRIVQAGRAHTPDWAIAAQTEGQDNARYTWLGEVSPSAIRRLYARSQAMVMSSVMEGGANVVSEACVAGLPVIASDIPGNTGLLGQDYPGFFPAGDSQALARLMRRVEEDPTFHAALTDWCLALAPRHTPAAEQAALLTVIKKVTQ